MQTNVLWTVALAIAVGVAGGCERASSSVLYPVRGHLIVGGQLAGNASIAFHRRDDAPLPPGGIPYLPVAVTGPDGSFSLMTVVADDGAPPGEYTVTVFWPDASIPFDECECPDPTQHDRLRGLYGDPKKSPLRVRVRPKENVVNLVAMEDHRLMSGGLPGAGRRPGDPARGAGSAPVPNPPDSSGEAPATPPR